MDEGKMMILSPADRQAVDALVEAGFDVRAVPAEHRRRAERVAAVLALLDHLPEERCGDLLTPRTLAAIGRQRQRRRAAQQDPSVALGGFRGVGIGLREVAAVAVLVLLSAVVSWPLIAQARTHARAIACQANLSQAGRAFAAYALAHNGVLPATKLRLGDHWDRTGRFDEEGYAQSNSAHLYQIVRGQYLSLRVLRCPENRRAPASLDPARRDWPISSFASFSYQNQYTSRRPKLDHEPQRAVLADRSPFFAAGQYNHEVGPDANSPNHGGRGQNVLLADGHVRWATEPALAGGDRIYHAGFEGLDYYTGVEPPANSRDSFLVP